MPGVAGGDGDLLGAVGVAVEPGLGDEEPRRPAGQRSARRSATARRPRPAAAAGRRRRRWGRGTRRTPRASPRPTRRSSRRRGRGRSWPASRCRRRPRPRRSSSSAAATAASSRSCPPRLARRRPSRPRRRGRRAGSRPSPPSGDGSVSVNRLTPTTTWSPDSMRRVRSAIDATSRAFSVVDWPRRRRRARGRRRARPRPRRRSSAVRASTTSRAVEDVVVLEQVGLEREHLLHPQRPLLVPRAGQAERLVPRRQLDAAGPGPLRQRDAEHLEHDALHVVLRLGLGEPEAVDLHAVAEAPRLGVVDAVALEADAVPQLGERAQLADLLDEADAGVDEEGDRGEHAGEPIGGDLAASRGRRRARRSRWPASRPAPAPASPRPPAGGTSTRSSGSTAARARRTRRSCRRSAGATARAGRCTCRATGTP